MGCCHDVVEDDQRIFFICGWCGYQQTVARDKKEFIHYCRYCLKNFQAWKEKQLQPCVRDCLINHPRRKNTPRHGYMRA